MTTYSNSIVSLDKLALPEYQRARQERRVTEIANNWNPAKAGVIIVARRKDGTLVILDGSHRTAAAIRAGVTELPALIYEGLTLADEAAMFLGLNDSKRVQAVDKFRAAVMAGDEMACQINEILVEYGWRVCWSSDPGSVAAVTALEAVYKGLGLPGFPAGAGLVRRTVAFITNTWGHDRDGMQGFMVRAIAAVLTRYEGQINEADLSARLAKVPPSHLVSDGAQLMRVTKQKRHAATARIVIQHYNLRRRSGVVPAFDWVN